MCRCHDIDLQGVLCFFFVKQKTAYEMRISDWSSDVCSSDLEGRTAYAPAYRPAWPVPPPHPSPSRRRRASAGPSRRALASRRDRRRCGATASGGEAERQGTRRGSKDRAPSPPPLRARSEEHTSELQSLMRISYAVFCLKQKPIIQSLINIYEPTNHKRTS